MAVTLSLVVLLGALIFFLLRLNYLRWGETLLCTVFGFLLASTGAAPAVQEALSALGNALGALHP